MKEIKEEIEKLQTELQVMNNINVIGNNNNTNSNSNNSTVNLFLAYGQKSLILFILQ